MRLALGTVQFGLDYGIANTAGRTPGPEAARILLRAREAGMDTLDTAPAYGSSERLLGEIGVAAWRVVTKVPRNDAGADSQSWVVEQVRRSLAALRVERVHAVLLHDASELLGEAGRDVARGLQEVKAQGLAERVGYSIYSPAPLGDLVKVLPPDVVQAPLNVFDQRLVGSGWLARLTDAGVEVHARSVFLQGLLLLSRVRRDPRFGQWDEHWQLWDALVERHGGSALEVCLGFVRQQEGVSRVVVGVDSVPHLEQVLSAWGHPVAVDGECLSCDDARLIEPVHWGRG